jgi:predicted dehydrogenase
LNSNTNTTDTKVVAALIGAGFMGSVHSRALRAAGIEIAGIVSSSKEKSEQACKALGIDRAYESVSDLLSDSRVNLVHILTPNQTHAELIDLALDAGKNIVCEKPLTVETSDARRLSDKALNLGLVGAIPFVYRYHAMARQARSKIQLHELGDLLSVRGEYLQDWLLKESDSNWRVDAKAGGPSRAFADIGIHLCDLIEFVAGRKITRLVSKMKTAYPIRQGQKVLTEDMALVMAELEGGGLASLMVSQVAAGHKNALVIELHGSKKSVRFEQENPELLWIGSQEGNLTEHRNPQQLSNDASRITHLPPGHPEGYFDAFVSFMKDVELAIIGNRPDGLPSFADGLRSSQLTDAVIQSSKTDSWIEVPNS